MTEKEQKNIFSKNLSNLIYTNNMTQLELSKAIGESKSNVNNWCRGTALPDLIKIQKIADYFGIVKSDLTEDHSEVSTDEEYAEICAKIGMTDSEFASIIIDYYKQTKEKKKAICDFYKTFITSKKDQD